MGNGKLLVVEVVYATTLVALQVPCGTTVIEAIKLSGLLEQFPEIDFHQNKMGIFSKLVNTELILSAGDRVEIYQPLRIDAKKARQSRVLQCPPYKTILL